MIKVLVVDDNEDSADMLAEALAAMGFHTRRALSGPAALALAQDFRPAIALLDIGLPGMDGYELARQFRAHTDLCDTRLIAVTGYSMSRDHAKTTAAGFDLHMVKPVDLAELVSTLNSLGPTHTPPR